MRIPKLEPLTLEQIEHLTPGAETDARIEQEFFGFAVVGKGKLHFFVDEDPGNPDLNTRSERGFSLFANDALKILEASPGWRAWQDDEGIRVQLTRIIGDGLTWINAVGRDPSFRVAICKAALLLCAYVREWEENQKQLDMAGAQTLEMAAEYAPASPENLITIKDKHEKA